MMKTFTEAELRSLVTLLDDRDERAVQMVRDEIMRIGEPIIPFLDEYRTSCPSGLAPALEAIRFDVRFQDLRTSFEALSASADPDLEDGAFLLCGFGCARVDRRACAAWLDGVAGEVRSALPPEPDACATMQRLNVRLFQELGFAGNEEDYYAPDNSYLSRVIDTKRGIPVSLSVLYLLLGRRLGLPVHGVGTPGHFLVGFTEPKGTVFFVDPFHKGRLMTSQDVQRMLTRSGYDFRREFLEPVSHRDIIVRMMRSLIAAYHKKGAAPRAEKVAVLADLMLRAGRAARPRASGKDVRAE